MLFDKIICQILQTDIRLVSALQQDLSVESFFVQPLARDNIETLKLCYSMIKRGVFPPLMVVADPEEGWVSYPLLFLTFCCSITRHV